MTSYASANTPLPVQSFPDSTYSAWFPVWAPMIFTDNPADYGDRSLQYDQLFARWASRAGWIPPTAEGIGTVLVWHAAMNDSNSPLHLKPPPGFRAWNSAVERVWVDQGKSASGASLAGGPPLSTLPFRDQDLAYPLVARILASTTKLGGSQQGDTPGNTEGGTLVDPNTAPRPGGKIGIQLLSIGDVSPDSRDVVANADANPDAVMGVIGMRTVTPLLSGHNRYGEWNRFPVRGVRYLDVAPSDPSQSMTGWWAPVMPAQVGEATPPLPSTQDRVKWGRASNVMSAERQVLNDAQQLGAAVSLPSAWGKGFAVIDTGRAPIILQPADSPYAPPGGTIDSPVAPDPSLPTEGPTDGLTGVPVTTVRPTAQIGTGGGGSGMSTSAPPNPIVAVGVLKQVFIAVAVAVLAAIALRALRKGS